MLRGRILSHSGAGVSGDAGIWGAAEKIPARGMGCQRWRVPSSAVIADEPERGDRRIPPPAHRDTTGGRSGQLANVPMIMNMTGALAGRAARKAGEAAAAALDGRSAAVPLPIVTPPHRSWVLDGFHSLQRKTRCRKACPASGTSLPEASARTSVTYSAS